MLSYKILAVFVILNYALAVYPAYAEAENNNRLPFGIMKAIFDMKTANKYQTINKNDLKKLFHNRNFNVQTSAVSFDFVFNHNFY